MQHVYYNTWGKVRKMFRDHHIFNEECNRVTETYVTSSLFKHGQSKGSWSWDTGETDNHTEIKQWGTFYHVIQENRWMWKREEERETEAEGKRSHFPFAIQNCCPSVLRQNGADDCLSLLPCVGRTPSRVLPPTILKIFLLPSAPSLPLSPVSLFHPPHTHSQNTSHTLSLSLC